MATLNQTAAATTAIVPGTLPPLPMRAGGALVRDVIDWRMTRAPTRDRTLGARLDWWAERIGHWRLDEIDEDHIAAGMDALAAEPARYYAGKDADGAPIWKGKAGPKSAGTLNRYLTSVAGVFTWAMKQRITPKGWVHPCRGVGKHREPAGKERFLTPAECNRLLAAAAASAWERMHLLVLLALSTGARRGELTGLRWRDIDLTAGTAHIARTKNEDAKVLHLVPGACEELRRFQGKADALVFGSARKPGQAYDFSFPWRAALKAAKIRGCRFHDLRHTAASRMAQAGVPALQIADILGHRSLNTTKRYSHFATEHKAAAAAKAMEGLEIGQRRRP